MNDLPILGITMGDPAGVGPEIVAKAVSRPDTFKTCRPLVIGDAWIMQKAIAYANVSLLVNRVKNLEAAKFTPGVLDVFDLDATDPNEYILGKVTETAGNAAFKSVTQAIELAMAKKIAGVVTAPIHKEAIVLAGHHFPGHTEIFAHFTNTKNVTMMLAAGDFRVVHVSTHVSLRQACDRATRERVLKVITLGHQVCQRLGIQNPKIGVAGLNPHASDGGLFGDEEEKEIRPAVNDAKAQGMTVEGPLPADTFFAKASSGAYDICVAMYHDQGHIPVKCKGFKFDPATNQWTSVRGINVSLGLPIIRTSVDHGTAFDQAGKGTASDESLIDAIEYAARLATIPA
ncbi:MAG: 4-hydroxythreonine-4-phosphate dehydrogenase PdxA [Tepidisphaeraceae bacterium]